MATDTRVLGVFARWLTDLEGCSPALYRQFSAARPGRLQITSEGLIAALR